MNEILPFKEILLLLLSTLSAYLIWRVQFQKDKLKTIESQLSEKKYEIYSELVYIIFDTMHGDKIGKKLNDKELLKRILNIKKNMFLYSSDNGVANFVRTQFLYSLILKNHILRNTKLDCQGINFNKINLKIISGLFLLNILGMQIL